MKRSLVLGAGGFIGHNLVKYLVEKGHFVVGADLKKPKFEETVAHSFILSDLRDYDFCKRLIDGSYDRIYQLAADMGGAGYVFTGDNDASIMANNVQINVNVLRAVIQSYSLPYANKDVVVFYSSSACIYPKEKQIDVETVDCKESSAYPANPDSEYGWEKLFSERLYLSFKRNFNVNVRIARFHNIFGECGEYEGGREKAPLALCRKVSLAEDGSFIEVWGDGEQVRSFLYIEVCLEMIERLINSNYTEPVNIGSEYMIKIKDLAKEIIKISGKNLDLAFNEDRPVGVIVRTSNNDLMREVLGWNYNKEEEYNILINGLKKTYNWLNKQINKE